MILSHSFNCFTKLLKAQKKTFTLILRSNTGKSLLLANGLWRKKTEKRTENTKILVQNQFSRTFSTISVSIQIDSDFFCIFSQLISLNRRKTQHNTTDMLVTTIDRIFYKSSHCCSARLKDFVNEDLMRNGWLLVALLFLLLSPSFRSVSVSVWRVCVHVCVCALCFGATAPSAGRNSSKYQHQFEALQNERTRERKNVFICLHHFLFCKLRL